MIPFTLFSIVPLKRLVDPSRPITYGIVQAGPDDPNGVPYIRPVDMSAEGGIRADALRRTSVDIASTYKRSAVKRDDLVVSIGPSFGKTMKVPPDLDGANLTQGTARVAVAGAVPDFVLWVLRSTVAQQYWEASVGGATFRALDLSELAATPIPLPTPDNQRRIVRFLADETARLDALIERCRALRHALDRLRASASLELPRGAVVPLRRVIDQICDGPFGSNMKTEHYALEGVRVIRLQNIGAGEFLDSDKSFVAREHFDSFRRHDARPGDLLVAGLGDEHNRLGRSCLVPETIGPAMVKADCFRLRLDQSRALHEYVMQYLNSATAESEIVWQGRGATRARMNAEGIRSIRLPLPSIDEQRVYVDRMSRIDATMRRLKSKIDEASRRLREYRSALITAAVTGQIDVGSAA